MKTRRNSRQRNRSTRLVGLAGLTLGVGFAIAPSAPGAAAGPAIGAPMDRCTLVLCTDDAGGIGIDLPIVDGLPVPLPSLPPLPVPLPDLPLPELPLPELPLPDLPLPELPTTGLPLPDLPVLTVPNVAGLPVIGTSDPVGQVLDVAGDIDDIDLGDLGDVTAAVPIDVNNPSSGTTGGVLSGQSPIGAVVDIAPSLDVNLLPGGIGDGTDSVVDLGVDLDCTISDLLVGPTGAQCSGGVDAGIDAGLVDADVGVDICNVSVRILSPAEQADCDDDTTTDDDDDTTDDDDDDDGDDDGDDDTTDDDGDDDGNSNDSGGDDEPRGIVKNASGGPSDSLPLTGSATLTLAALAAGLLGTGAVTRLAGARRNTDPLG